jgi:DNA-binding CsgD family transcriptional regulator
MQANIQSPAKPVSNAPLGRPPGELRPRTLIRGGRPGPVGSVSLQDPLAEETAPQLNLELTPTAARSNEPGGTSGAPPDEELRALENLGDESLSAGCAAIFGPSSGHEGLLLMNLTLDRVALDRGASEILNCPNPPGVKVDPMSYIPKPVRDLLRRSVYEPLQVTVYFPIGEQLYLWRAYRLDGNSSFIREPLVVLHVEKVEAESDPISEVAGKYSLTDRERETLRGVSMGLASKELAQLMGISPNTVKAFLRMIMLKMGVTSRGGIVANLLQSATVAHQASAEAGAPKKEIGREDENSDRRQSQDPTGPPAVLKSRA